ncbi:hypothetical protein [Brachybacterium hainanense]|uniref:Uncharacterized protein n=1 Tax=Brachybacterium hainanense TaxID=1541174 RepID=A0ABV6RG18_9MICO
MYTAPQPPPGSGRGRALLYGGITFALVFLLIIGAVVGYLVVRSVTAGDPGGTAGTATSSSAVGTASASTTPVPTEEEQYCWPSGKQRTTRNPPGKLAGGGLQFDPPEIFSERTNANSGLYFTDDEAVAMGAVIPGTWWSSVTVGAVHWQDGYEYPGTEKAADRITDCLLTAPVWGDMGSKTEANRKSEAVEIDGVEGHKVSLDYEFGKSDLAYPDGTKITASHLIVIVVETENGPSFFAAEYPVGNAEHEAAVTEALTSLEVTGG